MAENTSNTTEVLPTRRIFSAEFKEALLAEIDAAKSSEDVGLILRREGLYSSQIYKWKRKQKTGKLAVKRGVKPRSEIEKRNSALTDEINQLKERLALAEELIEAQGKVWALLHETSAKSASQKPQQ